MEEVRVGKLHGRQKEQENLSANSINVLTVGSELVLCSYHPHNQKFATGVAGELEDGSGSLRFNLDLLQVDV